MELLSTGYMLSYSRDKKLRRILNDQSDKIWFSIDRRHLYNTLNRLHLDNLVEEIKEANNINKIKLTQPGRAKFLKLQLSQLKITTPHRWDKKWRMVMFDIPEQQRVIRDSLRKNLKNLGFLEFQKSVFVYPFPCQDQINFVINCLGISEYVYYVESSIFPDSQLRKIFSL